VMVIAMVIPALHLQMLEETCHHYPSPSALRPRSLRPANRDLPTRLTEPCLGWDVIV
jgi:hypothetical protein